MVSKTSVTRSDHIRVNWQNRQRHTTHLSSGFTITSDYLNLNTIRRGFELWIKNYIDRSVNLNVVQLLRAIKYLAFTFQFVKNSTWFYDLRYWVYIYGHSDHVHENVLLVSPCFLLEGSLHWSIITKGLWYVSTCLTLVIESSWGGLWNTE